MEVNLEVGKWLDEHSRQVQRVDPLTGDVEYLEVVPRSEVEQFIKDRYYDYSH